MLSLIVLFWIKLKGAQHSALRVILQNTLVNIVKTVLFPMYTMVPNRQLILSKKKYDTMEAEIKNEITQLQQQQGSTSMMKESEKKIKDLRKTLKDLETEKKKKIQKTGRKQLTWPASTRIGKLRTIESITEIANEIEANPDVLKNDYFCKGIKGKSLFLDQPFFNLIIDMPCEYMHLVCLGSVKRLVELTFKVGENRDRKTKRRLSDPKLFNAKILCIQFPREIGRRVRNMDFGVLKALEFRNIILFLFPIVLDCIEDTFPKEKKVWLNLVYMIRACTLSNDEFRNVKNTDIENASSKFYTLYEDTYGPQNCTYSIHVVGSHILKVRNGRPLTFKSAFKFENFFAEMKHLYQPGTVSPLKQILANCYVKRQLEYHVCEKEPFYAAKKNQKKEKKITLERKIILLYIHSMKTTKSPCML